jgi:hypothetical protein
MFGIQKCCPKTNKPFFTLYIFEKLFNKPFLFSKWKQLVDLIKGLLLFYDLEIKKSHHLWTKL